MTKDALTRYYMTGKLTFSQRRAGMQRLVEIFSDPTAIDKRKPFPQPIDALLYERSVTRQPTTTMMVVTPLALPGFMGSMLSEMFIGPLGYVAAGVFVLGTAAWAMKRSSNWDGRGILKKHVYDSIRPAFQRWALERYGIHLTPSNTLLGFLCTQTKAAEISFQDDNGKTYLLAADGLGYFQILDEAVKKESQAPAKFGELQTQHDGERVLRETLALLPGETALLYMEVIRKLVTLSGQEDLTPESTHAMKRVQADLDEAVSAFKKYMSWGEPATEIVTRLAEVLSGLSADLSDAIEMERHEAGRALTVQSEYVRSRRLISEPRLQLPQMRSGSLLKRCLRLRSGRLLSPAPTRVGSRLRRSNRMLSRLTFTGGCISIERCMMR